MAKDPAFLFYSQDFYVGCVGMTDEEVGRYIKILCIMHQRGRLSETVIKQFGEITPILKEKFLVDEQGLWYQSRLEEESLKRKNYTESRRTNAKSKQENSKNEAYAKHMDSHMENEDENVNEDMNKKEVLPFEEIKNKWNELASACGLRTIKALESKRRQKIKARYSEAEFEYDEILALIRGSTFLKGVNDREWKVTFDWIFENSNNYLKILEGMYSEKRKNGAISPFTTWKSNGTGNESQLIEFDNEKEVGKLKRLDGTGEPFRITKYDLLKQYSQIQK